MLGQIYGVWMSQSEHKFSINWRGYAKIAIHIAMRLSEEYIEESSAYALLTLTELSIPLIGAHERSLSTRLDIGAASISIDVKYTLYPEQ